MSRRFHLVTLLLVANILAVGCSSQREFTGWSLPKFNPLSWWKKDQPPAPVTKPSEIAGVPRTQNQPGYAAVSSAGSGPQAPTYGAPAASGYSQPVQTGPAPGWSSPPIQPPNYPPPNNLPGPQVGFYGSQATSPPGVRVAERTAYGASAASPGSGYTGYGSGWNAGANVGGSAGVSYNPAGSYQHPGGTWNPPTVGASAYQSPASTHPAGYSSPTWQGNDGAGASLGPRYDVNASRYNLSGANPAGISGAMAPQSGVSSSGTPGNPWGYNPPTINPGPAAQPVGTPSSGGGGMGGYNSPASSSYPPGVPSQSGASTSGVGGTVSGQVQPAGFTAGLSGSGFGQGAPSASRATGQSWTPGGPTPNMPGRVDYQPGNTGYQPGATGYQPPSPVATGDSAPGSSSPRTGSTSGSGTSPFLPGSIRPYVPPTTSGNNSSRSQSETASGLGLAGLPPSRNSQAGTTGSSFCTLDGKCETMP